MTIAGLHFGSAFSVHQRDGVNVLFPLRIQYGVAGEYGCCIKCFAIFIGPSFKLVVELARVGQYIVSIAYGYFSD